MTYPHVQEAWQAAMEPAEITYSNDVYGQIEFDVWFCVLQKNVGKVVFDPGTHRANERRTAITVNIADIGGNNYKREFIAEIPTDGWAGVTLPSLKALGVTDLSKLNGAYVHAEMVKHATYKKSDGTEGVKTAPKVTRIFKDLDDCAAAAQGNTPEAQMDWTNAKGVNGNGSNAGPAVADNGERHVALSFLPAIVKGCVRGNGIDMPALEAALKGNPILAKYFTLGSAEVMTAIQAALAEPAF